MISARVLAVFLVDPTSSPLSSQSIRFFGGLPLLFLTMASELIGFCFGGRPLFFTGSSDSSPAFHFLLNCPSGPDNNGSLMFFSSGRPFFFLLQDALVLSELR